MGVGGVGTDGGAEDSRRNKMALMTIVAAVAAKINKREATRDRCDFLKWRADMVRGEVFVRVLVEESDRRATVFAGAIGFAGASECAGCAVAEVTSAAAKAISRRKSARFSADSNNH